MVEQVVQHLGVGVVPVALSDQFTVPLKTVAFQGVQDCRLGAGFFAWRVEVFHTHQPAAMVGAGVEVEARAATSEPKCRCPLGVGAKRPI